jgi:energy-converting hydrogenase A subunit R
LGIDFRRREKVSKQFVTDCEGPITLNDNALELSEHFIPDGASFFAKLSRYDDYLADIARREGYKAGDTLKLILPFLKAYGATNDKIASFSREHILLVRGADKTLRFVNERMDSFIISTSYVFYIRAICDIVHFPFENTYSTRLDIDKYQIDQAEEERLRVLKNEIDALPSIEIPADARSLRDLPVSSQSTIERLETIFYEEIPKLKSGAILREVNPVGGFEKANALRDSLERTSNSLSQTMYVGDSITDVEALELVRAAGGLGVSFNGNRYAIEAAEVAAISEGAYVTACLADTFLEGGKDQVYKLLKGWSQSIMEEIKLEGGQLPRAALITDSNKEELIAESEALRQRIRGIAGTLG